MGLMVPAYGYYSAMGTGDNRRAGTGEFNERSRTLLNTFFNFIRHPIVKDIAIRERAVYGREEDMNLREIDWRGPTVYELEVDTRPELNQLMGDIRDRGTIVVPTFEHLRSGMYNHAVLDRLCKSSLAPVPAQELTLQIRFLEQDLLHPLKGLRLRKFEDNVVKFFLSATNQAVQVQRQLENSRLRRTAPDGD